ncbi:hypothetical protein BDV95DRAFT_586042 [Massariosphaeria phaeospora]|uniref:F-box domain-containing protein n=1 Tax=Massariosphaeria phaeospora TaxID=100035 RepID=A0A7C8M4N2_9PLEO|nr:hypothetical protein BDV95DRAFT_586042 [Massariosphaeria phaeospora]
MALLDLPLEILDAIIDCTLPAGLESFVLSCKSLYRRAAGQIERHNALRRRWGYTHTESGPRRADTLRILYHVSRDALVAEYIDSLSLWDRRPVVDFSDSEDGEQDFRDDAAAMAGIKELVTRSEYLRIATVEPEAWWDKMLQEQNVDLSDHQDALFAAVFLFSLLPNLRTLRLPRTWSEFRPADDDQGEHYRMLAAVLNAIVETANDESGNQKPLGQLTTILPFMAEGYEERAALESVQPAITLCSMRELYAISSIALDDGYTGIAFSWPASLPNTPLTRLELAYCCVDADGITDLLSHAPSIRVVKYSHQSKWHGCGHDWNCGAFLQALSSTSSATIDELAITIDDLDGEIINGASTFHGFPHLRKLEIDVTAFCGPPLESGQRKGQEPLLPAGERPWSKEDIPCLGDMLPTSIEEVHINTEHPDPDSVALCSLLKNVIEHRANRLHGLHKFVLRQYQGTSSRALAVEKGILFETWGHSPEGPLPIHMMPLWKREFEAKAGIELGS